MTGVFNDTTNKILFIKQTERICVIWLDLVGKRKNIPLAAEQHEDEAQKHPCQMIPEFYADMTNPDRK